MAEKRFVKVYSQDMGNKFILVDRQTGVNYLFVASGFSGGLSRERLRQDSSRLLEFWKSTYYSEEKKHECH